MEAVCSANDGNYVPVCTASQANCYRRDNLKYLVHFACHLHTLAGLPLAKMANSLYSERQTTSKQTAKSNTSLRLLNAPQYKTTPSFVRSELHLEIPAPTQTPVRNSLTLSVPLSRLLECDAVHSCSYVLTFRRTYCIHIELKLNKARPT